MDSAIIVLFYFCCLRLMNFFLYLQPDIGRGRQQPPPQPSQGQPLNVGGVLGEKDYISYTVSAPSGRGTAMFSVDGKFYVPIQLLTSFCFKGEKICVLDTVFSYLSGVRLNV